MAIWWHQAKSSPQLTSYWGPPPWWSFIVFYLWISHHLQIGRGVHWDLDLSFSWTVGRSGHVSPVLFHGNNWLEYWLASFSDSSVLLFAIVPTILYCPWATEMIHIPAWSWRSCTQLGPKGSTHCSCLSPILNFILWQWDDWNFPEHIMPLLPGNALHPFLQSHVNPSSPSSDTLSSRRPSLLLEVESGFLYIPLFCAPSN